MSAGVASYAGFGRYLKGQRCLRGLSIDEVARVTKLPCTVLGALEEGRAEALPERVFLVAHIRSYATAVGLEPADCLARFQALPGGSAPPAFDPRALEAARRERATQVLWGLWAGAASLLLAGTWLALQDWMLKFAMR